MTGMDKRKLVSYLREYVGAKKKLADTEKEIASLQSGIARTEQGPALTKKHTKIEYNTAMGFAAAALFFLLLSLLPISGWSDTVYIPIRSFSSIVLVTAVFAWIWMHYEDNRIEKANQASIEKNRQEFSSLSERKQRLNSAEGIKTETEELLRNLEAEGVFSEQKYQDHAEKLADYLESGRADTMAEAEKRLEHLWEHQRAHEEVCSRLRQLESLVNDGLYYRSLSREAASEAASDRAMYSILTRDKEE